MIRMYSIEFTKKAKKFFNKQDSVTKKRLKHSLLQLAENPRDNTNKDVKLLKGASEPTFRLRVGSIRVVYKLEDDQLLIIVIDIDNRGQVYKNL